MLAFLGKHVSLPLRPADFLEIIYYEVIIGVLSKVIITGKDKLSPWQKKEANNSTTNLAVSLGQVVDDH